MKKRKVEAEDNSIFRFMSNEPMNDLSTPAEIIQRMFTYAFRDNEFVMGIDSTGFYIFSTHKVTDDQLEARACKVIDDLALEPEQIQICVVDRVSEFEWCSRADLDSWIRKKVRSRKRVLSREDIQEILNAYNFQEDKDEGYYLDFRNCELYKELENVFEEHSSVISAYSLHQICLHHITEREQLLKLDVEVPMIPYVIKTVRAGYECTPERTDKRVDLSNPISYEVKPIKEQARRENIVITLLLLAEIVFILSARYWGISVVFFGLIIYFTILVRRRAHRVDYAEFAKVLATLILLTRVIFYIATMLEPLAINHR